MTRGTFLPPITHKIAQPPGFYFDVCCIYHASVRHSILPWSTTLNLTDSEHRTSWPKFFDHSSYPSSTCRHLYLLLPWSSIWATSKVKSTLSRCRCKMKLPSIPFPLPIWTENSSNNFSSAIRSIAHAKPQPRRSPASPSFHSNCVAWYRHMYFSSQLLSISPHSMVQIPPRSLGYLQEPQPDISNCCMYATRVAVGFINFTFPLLKYSLSSNSSTRRRWENSIYIFRPAAIIYFWSLKTPHLVNLPGCATLDRTVFFNLRLVL